MTLAAQLASVALAEQLSSVALAEQLASVAMPEQLASVALAAQLALVELAEQLASVALAAQLALVARAAQLASVALAAQKAYWYVALAAQLAPVELVARMKLLKLWVQHPRRKHEYYKMIELTLNTCTEICRTGLPDPDPTKKRLRLNPKTPKPCYKWRKFGKSRQLCRPRNLPTVKLTTLFL